jgi:hypothetical protein
MRSISHSFPLAPSLGQDASLNKASRKHPEPSSVLEGVLCSSDELSVETTKFTMYPRESTIPASACVCDPSCPIWKDHAQSVDCGLG